MEMRTFFLPPYLSSSFLFLFLRRPLMRSSDFDDEIPNGIFFSFSSLLSFLFSSPESPLPLHPR